MSWSSRSFVDRERAAVADLMTTLGPDAPTCCEGWTTAHLAAHLVVRDRRPDALAGYALESAGQGGPLVEWSHKTEDRLRTSTPYAAVVARVRSGPPWWWPMAWPPVEQAINVTEFVVHHEDVRRAQPGWTPRELARADRDAIWSAAGWYGRRAAGRRGLVLRRTDVPGQERRYGAAGRTVEGDPLELLLWLARRRDVARVTVT
jgi:uncharacterized protein (TIGR03085 family)